MEGNPPDRDESFCTNDTRYVSISITMLDPILKVSTPVQVCLKQLTLSHILFSIPITAARLRILTERHLDQYSIDGSCVPLLSTLLMKTLPLA